MEARSVIAGDRR